MTGKNTYFISDLHLGAPYFPDSHKSERRVVSFLESIRHDAKAILLVGDILDYWYEYRYVVPKGYVRFFGKLAELSDDGIEIIWLLGNHDIWLFDYLPSELGIRVADGPLIYETDDRKFMVAHGDGLGKNPFSFMILRSLFRSKICQRLYSMINPRWTIPFAQRWSRSSRESRCTRRKCDKSRKKECSEEEMFSGITEYAEQYTLLHPEVEACVFGHFHYPLVQTLPNGKKMIILGDWITNFTYGILRPGEEIKLEKFSDS